MYNFDGWSQQGNGGAGGGLYGGYTNQYASIPYSGAGGSGYIGGVPVFTYNGNTYSPTWMTGHSSANGNGKAIITLVAPYATASNITLSSNSIIPPAAIGVTLENSQMSTINHVVTWTLGSKSHTVELATGAKNTSYTIP